MVSKIDDERFQNGAQDYAAYLETPEGRLRADLVFANLQDLLPQLKTNKQLFVLDVGCGTGALAVRLAQLGFHITQLYVDNPATVLCGAARTLRDTSAILSLVVRNQAGEVLKAAIQAGDLPAAETNLNAEWGFESLYGGRVRLFTSAGPRAMLASESLELIAERGVRVVADYLPPSVSRTATYERIFELERRLGVRPEFAAIARYSHCLARRRENAA